MIRHLVAAMVVGVLLWPSPARAESLEQVKLSDEKTGLHVTVYYDAVGKGAAPRSGPTVLRLLSKVATLCGVDPAKVAWAHVAFREEGHTEAITDAGRSVWTVPVARDGRLTEEGERALYGTVPHEQTHVVQRAARSELPRWFSEGHATWVELQVVSSENRAMADGIAAMLASAWQAHVGPFALASWGEQRVKREAFLRQVSPAEKERMLANPTYVPAGAFSFNDDDIEEDIRDVAARYGRSLVLFQAMFMQGGRENFQRWIRAVLDSPVKTPQIVELAGRYGMAPSPWMQ